ncbi:MAG: hypothetical protein ACRD4U_07170 [Candidatus Acidiferrales bacterium]
MEITLRLRTTVDAKSSQEGDRIICTIEEPVVIDQIEVIPVGARVHGRIAGLKKAGRLGRGGELVLTFDTIDVPGTGHIPITGSVVDLFDPDDEEARKETMHLGLGLEGEITGGGPGKVKRYGTIAGSAATGTALGGVKGAAIGIVAGTAFSYIFWKGKEVDLPAGTGIVIEIDRSVAFSIPEMPVRVGDAPRPRSQ